MVEYGKAKNFAQKIGISRAKGAMVQLATTS
jgi:hypothetical protein